MVEKIVQSDARAKCYESGVIQAYNVPYCTKKKGGNNGGTKKYKRNKTKIYSSVSRQYHNRVNKIVFITFTNPADEIYRDLKECNIRFSRFLENLRKNYKLHSYLWVAERQKNEVVHYHTFFDIPKFDIIAMRRAYNQSMQHDSTNCLRLPPNKKNTFLHNYSEACTYVTKYVTKEKTTELHRVFGCSQNITSKPITINAHDLHVIEGLLFCCKRTEYTTQYIVKKQVIQSYLKLTEQMKNLYLEQNENFNNCGRSNRNNNVTILPPISID